MKKNNSDTIYEKPQDNIKEPYKPGLKESDGEIIVPGNNERSSDMHRRNTVNKIQEKLILPGPTQTKQQKLCFSDLWAENWALLGPTDLDI